MKHIRWPALLAILLLLAGCYINPQLSGKITAESTETQTIAVGESPAVEIANFVGVVKVSEGAPGEVTATLTRQSRHDDPAAAEALLDQITWSLIQTGDGARILIEGPDGANDLKAGLSAVAEVQVPPGSDLTVDLGAGEASFDRPTGDVTYNGGAGLAKVILPSDASFTLRVTGGVAAVDSDFAGVPSGGVATDLTHTVGENPTQSLTFNMGAGEIKLEQAP